MQSDEMDILALTIYGEARGEYGSLEGGIASLIAIGNVVMNRFKAQSNYGKTIQEVCQKPWQFSCWNRDDPNQVILTQAQLHDPIYNICYKVATKVAKGEWPDLTKGSDHYHAISLPVIPQWAKGQKPILRLARHIFYKLNKGV